MGTKRDHRVSRNLTMDEKEHLLKLQRDMEEAEREYVEACKRRRLGFAKALETWPGLTVTKIAEIVGVHRNQIHTAVKVGREQ